ncbi:hypothetical protein BZA70DRAFT_103920 [Myxozyma melibiosi]|uniref:Glycosyltransferase family 25 protein n=1 Tax=Myxozyma melibiosi TaxID=54550 RepID=A0ABR1EXP5_9ASCO
MIIESLSPSMRRRCSFLLLLIPVLGIIVIVFESSRVDHSSHPSNVLSSVSASTVSETHDIIADTHNETLGFGAVLLLSLPSRTDRHDAISLIAAHTGIKITKTIYGVVSDDVDKKAYPYGDARKKFESDRFYPYLGSWRSHMDIFRYIVDNRIQTALILEDDLDWDMNVKDQFEALARGLRNSTIRRPFSEEELETAPYGLDWDILHIGCSQVRIAGAPRDQAFTVYTDEYRAPNHITKNPCNPFGYFCWEGLMKHAKLKENQRAIYPTHESVGLSAFAVTYTGAQRLLYQLSYKELTDTLDRSISKLTMQGAVRGWTVIPPMMGEFKVDSGKDTNLNVKADMFSKDVSNLKGHGPGLLRSARQSLTETWEGDSANYWVSEKAYWGKQEEKADKVGR